MVAMPLVRRHVGAVPRPGGRGPRGCVEAGLIQSAQNAYTEYPDLHRDEWETKIRPALKRISLSILQKKSGLSRMMLINARTGRTRPHRKNRELLASAARKMLGVR